MDSGVRLNSWRIAHPPRLASYNQTCTLKLVCSDPEKVISNSSKTFAMVFGLLLAYGDNIWIKIVKLKFHCLKILSYLQTPLFNDDRDFPGPGNPFKKFLIPSSSPSLAINLRSSGSGLFPASFPRAPSLFKISKKKRRYLIISFVWNSNNYNNIIIVLK